MPLLKSLFGKEVSWKWGPVQQQVFDDVNEWLFFPVVTAFPDFSKCFQVYTYASERGLGAVMAQFIHRKREAYLMHQLFSQSGQKKKSTEKKKIVPSSHWGPPHILSLLSQTVLRSPNGPFQPLLFTHYKGEKRLAVP